MLLRSNQEKGCQFLIARSYLYRSPAVIFAILPVVFQRGLRLTTNMWGPDCGPGIC